MNEALLAFGANLGNPEQTFQKVLNAISNFDCADMVHSGLFLTKPIGGPDAQPAFRNAAIRIHTTHSPDVLVQRLLEIELNLGRKRTERWNARTVDLDLLLFNDLISREIQCQVPHPRMSFRRFMLEPSCEIAGNWNHPVCNQKLTELLAQIRFGDRTCAWFGPIPENARRICTEQNYQLRPVDSPFLSDGELNSLGERPRLVVINQKRDFSSRTKNQILGPYLDLLEIDEGRLEEELLAALQAMEPMA